MVIDTHKFAVNKEGYIMVNRKLSDMEKAKSKERRRMKHRLKQQEARSSPDYRAHQNHLQNERRARKRKQSNVQPTDCKKPCLEGLQSCSHGVLQSVDSNPENVGSSNVCQKPKNVQPTTLDSSQSKKKTKKSSAYEKLEKQFFDSISDGPIHRCMCCDRLWFKKSITNVPLFKIKNYMPKSYEFVFSEKVQDVGSFCKTCYSYIRKGQIPPLAANYGFKYVPLPPCLAKLNDLEERLVSLRIPFMQIKELGSTRQFGCKGSVVNVPIELENTITHLPKNPNDSQTIYVKLKKRLRHKSHYLSQHINPKRVFEAAEFLLQTPLYQSQGAQLDLSWLKNYDKQTFPSGIDSEVNLISSDDEDDDNPTEFWDDELQNDEDDEEFTTLAETIIEPSNKYFENMGLTLAPGENKIPISLWFDTIGDELSYPKIYGGQVRIFTRPKEPSYLEMCNSELRRYERRGATPQKVLYNFLKLSHQQMLSCISIALRNKVVSNENITVENIRNAEYVQNLQYKDLAYKFMKNVKSSPAHWAQERKRVLAQIRQFGSPTIFLTLSAAESQWYDLIKHLVFIHEDRLLTKDDFKSMASQRKVELIRNDPVICALYFEHKVSNLFKLLNDENGPFGQYKIEHYYYRVEFQQRGSPHYHILIHLKNVPVYTGDNENEIVKFVDSLLTCSLDHPFAILQRHKHTFTCERKKGNNEYCRFNIPFFPMDKTRVLNPLGEDDKRFNKNKYKEIRDYLAELENENLEMSFQDFLANLNLELNAYLDAICSGIKRPTVMLKRNVNEILINSYNPKILTLMQSNMDLQFVLDQYAVVAYLVDYVGKSNAGLSKQMRNCVDATKSGNMSLKENLKKMSNVFLNAREVSAQEAAWSLLELPMSKISEDDIFIPTFAPNQRSHMIKPEQVLKNLDKSSTDVFEKSIIDKYVIRPQKLDDECLADFAAWYDFKQVGDIELKLKMGKQYCKKRTKSKIIRYCNFKRAQDEEEFYREQIMLFLPWRDEENDILNQNFKQLYESNLDQIKDHRKKYVFNEDIDWDAEFMEKISNDSQVDDNGENLNEVVPFENQLDYDEKETNIVNIGVDMDAEKGFATFLMPEIWPEKKLFEMSRKANEKQREILLEFQHCIRHETEPIFWFIQGAAGTGKSFLISLFEQVAYKTFDYDPTYPVVVKMAPTGKAAANISGTTLHSGLGLSLSTTKLKSMSPSTLNEYQVKFQNCRVIIIDEISMVGVNLLNAANQRLKEIKSVNSQFGGLNVILLGDLRQLPPVKDTPLYQKSKRNNLEQLGPNLFESVKFYELTEIMRQKEDQEFAMLLNNLADGTLTDKQIDCLKARVTTLDKIPHTVPLLFYTNKEVNEANTIRLNAIEGELIDCLAVDCVTGTGTASRKLQLLEGAKNKSRQESGNLSYKIKLKIGARYMLTTNVDIVDGLVNGSIGILRMIETCPIINSKEMGVKRVWLEFLDSTHIGKNKRSQAFRYMIGKNISHKWTPIERYKKSINKTKNGALSVIRNQLPLVVAEAMTIHKSQGATFEECAVGLTPNMSPQLYYVACSRCKKLDTLHFFPKFHLPKAPKEDNPVLKAFMRLNQNPVIPRFKFLRECCEPYGLQMMYHNVQSLNKHYEDIKCDPCFMNSDILLLTETWTIQKDQFIFEGFHRPYVILSDLSRRKPTGVSIYLKKNILDLDTCENYSNYDTGVHLLVVQLRRCRIAALYAKPQSSIDDILHAINESLPNTEDMITILFGDFNIEMNSEKGLELRDILADLYDLHIRNDPKQFTTKGRTTIDAIFSSKPLLCCGVYESVFSYHLPLYARCDSNLFPNEDSIDKLLDDVINTFCDDVTYMSGNDDFEVDLYDILLERS